MNIFRKIFLNEWIIAVAIIANSVTLFLMGFKGLEPLESINIIDHLFTFFFVMEVITKVSTWGWGNYIKEGGNKFDFILVLISIPSMFEIFFTLPDVSYLLVFRLLRVLRILRFMRFIPNITQMIAGIQRAFRASVFVFVALFIYNVLLAVLSTYLFRDYSSEFFGDPLLSLYSIFQIFTLEGWNEIPATVIAGAGDSTWVPGFARIFFVMVVLTGGIFGFSIVNAIFVDEMVQDNNDGLEAKVDEMHAKVDRLIQEMEQRKGQ